MSLRSQAEDWLGVLLWGMGKMMSPTLPRIFETYDGWEYRTGRHRWHRLEKAGLVEKRRETDQLVYRLTTAGRLVAYGGRDAPQLWNRSWDRHWRLMVFDLPADRPGTRQRLLRWLRARGFGYLQGSVWISPDPVADFTAILTGFRDVESLTVIEGRCVAGHSDADLVLGAWDFAEINNRHRHYLSVAATAPVQPTASAPTWPEWLRRERRAWLRAFTLDPLLPQALWPAGYLGQQAWDTRRTTFAALATPRLPLRG
jgi:DNA-binding transcriptional regulator PaaX